MWKYKPIRGYDWHNETDMPNHSKTMTVMCDDDQPVNTGLLDANGTPLYRVRERTPIGFKLR